MTKKLKITPELQRLIDADIVFHSRSEDAWFNGWQEDVDLTDALIKAGFLKEEENDLF